MLAISAISHSTKRTDAKKNIVIKTEISFDTNLSSIDRSGNDDINIIKAFFGKSG